MGTSSYSVGLEILAGEGFHRSVGAFAGFVEVARSAHRAVMRKPVTCWIMSIQCDPMSPMARRAPPNSDFTRQFQSVSWSSQS